MSEIQSLSLLHQVSSSSTSEMTGLPCQDSGVCADFCHSLPLHLDAHAAQLCTDLLVVLSLVCA